MPPILAILLTLELAADGLVEVDRTRAGGWAVGAKKPAWKVVHDFATQVRNHDNGVH
jgi:hypothetical protein